MKMFSLKKNINFNYIIGKEDLQKNHPCPGSLPLVTKKARVKSI